MLGARPGVVIPSGALRTLQRLFDEQPGAMTAFLGWCEYPSHTQTVSLSFQNGRLTLAELRTTAK